MPKSQKRAEQLPVLHPDAAGVDIGASEIFVAVSPNLDPKPVRSFATFTRDLNALADWLQRCECMPRERTIRAKCAGSKNRRVGLSVDSVSALSWSAAAKSSSQFPQILTRSLYVRSLHSLGT